MGVPAQVRCFVVSADVHAPPSGAEPHSSASVDTSAASASFACPRVRFADPPVSAPSVSAHPDDDDDDDAASVASNLPAVDKTVTRLAAYIHDQFPDLCLLTASSQAPRCGFEAFYAVVDPLDSNRPRFCHYRRVTDIVDDILDSANKHAQTSKPLSSVLPKCRRFHSVTDVADFTAPRALNSDFSRLAENKTISLKCSGMISFFEMERVESSTRSLLVGQSYSLWLLSGLVSQLKRDGFAPTDPALFDSAISSLSASIAGQIRTSATLTDFFCFQMPRVVFGPCLAPIVHRSEVRSPCHPGFGHDPV